MDRSLECRWRFFWFKLKSAVKEIELDQNINNPILMQEGYWKVLRTTVQTLAICKFDMNSQNSKANA